MGRKNSDRDQEICRLYEHGKTLNYLGKLYNLSRERVRQILMTSQTPRRKDKTGRVEFLGVNLAPSVKDALREQAAEQQVSMSALASHIITIALDVRSRVRR